MEQNTFIWYRKAKDFKLLMDLLAEQSGLAHSFRILAVFDKHFQRLWRARDVKIIIKQNSVNLGPIAIELFCRAERNQKFYPEFRTI